jgi:NAD kinase
VTAKSQRVVIITRPTAYELLKERHGTLGQARFFLERRGQSLESLLEIHRQHERSLLIVERSIPSDWRRSRVMRDQLDRFLFEPDDLVVAVGQDGLVANAAKYLAGQPVIGVNPSPDRYPGVLVPHSAEAGSALLVSAAEGRSRLQRRAMVEAQVDDGQRFVALNEVFVGHSSHQSARYSLVWQGRQERQSSSGLIVSTGTGATGWARSIHAERHSGIELPGPSEASLAFFVREAWPSISTGTEITEGRLNRDERLIVISEMETGGVAFGDGIEADRIELLWGQRVELGIAATTLNLVVGSRVGGARPRVTEERLQRAREKLAALRAS